MFFLKLTEIFFIAGPLIVLLQEVQNYNIGFSIEVSKNFER